MCQVWPMEKLLIKKGVWIHKFAYSSIVMESKLRSWNVDVWVWHIMFLRVDCVKEKQNKLMTPVLYVDKKTEKYSAISFYPTQLSSYA